MLSVSLFLCRNLESHVVVSEEPPYASEHSLLFPLFSLSAVYLV